MPVFMTREELDEYGDDLDAERGKYLPLIRPFPDVRALLERVRADLATYKKIANIEDPVDVETSSDDAQRSKPHPDIFQAVLDRLRGVRADRTIAVGDTPYDAEAAAKAGIRTIGMLCGGWSGEDLTRSGCIAVYKDPADLLALYGAWPLV